MYVINYHYRQTFQVSPKPQRGGVAGEVLAFISGPNIVIESWKACFERALWSGNKEGPGASKPPNDFQDINTLANTV